MAAIGVATLILYGILGSTTPLVLASRGGHTSTALSHINDLGSRVNAACADGITPLM